MTYIQNIPECDNRERLRAEIFRNLGQRRDDAQQAFTELCKYMGFILPGGTIAILSFIASRKDSPIPLLSILSLLSFVISILSFSILLYRHYQLQQSRWNLYADAALVASPAVPGSPICCIVASRPA